MQEIKQRISALLDTYRAELEHMADDIFDHPETGFNEVYASGLLCGWLEAHGFAVQRGVGTISTAFRAEYQCGEGGPAIGLLAEYDALAGIGFCFCVLMGLQRSPTGYSRSPNALILWPSAIHGS